MTLGKIENLFEKLEELGFKPKFYQNMNFNDDPMFYCYAASLKITKKNTDGKLPKEPPHGSGMSYFSPDEALSKAIFESMERFCEHSYKKTNIFYSIGKKNNFMDLTAFLRSDLKHKIGWVEGWNLTENKKSYIPASLIFLNYKRMTGEPEFNYPSISTGSAGGASLEQATLNGIYEFVERDAIMSVYLNRISPPIVNLSSVKDSRIGLILKKFSKFNLNLMVWDVTNDVGIPSFLAGIVDRKGFPVVSFGSRSGLRVKDAIVAAITEASFCRQVTRHMLRDGDISPDLKKGNNVFSERSRHWVEHESFNNVKFLFSDNYKNLSSKKFKGNQKRELSRVVEILKNRGFTAFSYETTTKEFKDLGFYSYQVIIPGLQPLYLWESEKKKSINNNRLKEVAAFYKSEFSGVNEFPHPFL